MTRNPPFFNLQCKLVVAVHFFYRHPNQTHPVKFVMAQKGPYLVAASYDLSISVSDLSSDAAPLKFGLQNAQGNRILPLGPVKFAVASNPAILVYDRTAKTNKPCHAFSGHQTNVTDLCTDGTRIYSCSEDESWRVWEPSAPRAVAVHPSGCCLNGICLFQSKWLATGNDRCQVELWNPGDGEKVASATIADTTIRTIEATSEYLIVGALSGKAYVVTFDGTTVTTVKQIEAHSGPITHSATSPDGRYFATASADATAKLWTLPDAELKHVCADKGQTRWVWGVAFTPDSKTLCTGGSDKVCRVWDVETGELKKQIESHQKAVTCIAVLQ
jgi:WD40 repeat protein